MPSRARGRPGVAAHAAAAARVPVTRASPSLAGPHLRDLVARCLAIGLTTSSDHPLWWDGLTPTRTSETHFVPVPDP